MAILIRQFFLAALLLCSAAAYAQDNLQLAEQEIKAGLLYNFLKYTDWPAADIEKSAAMTLCVFGQDPFSGYLQPMSGRTVNQRKITVRQVKSAGDLSDCRLLFVSAAEKTGWPALQETLKGRPVLTVSDIDGFAGHGGMIEFGRSDSHISVSLNADAVAAGGLRVEDRLLRLVTVVKSEGK